MKDKDYFSTEGNMYILNLVLPGSDHSVREWLLRHEIKYMSGSKERFLLT